MTKISFATHPYLLGFDQLDRLVERTAKNANDSYPPYNIEALSKTHYRITIALAGFSEDDVEIVLEANQLMIRGHQKDTKPEHVFLHRGIATRQFQRAFVLADGVNIGEASMENGLLHIELEREIPDNITKTIPIKRK